MTLNLSPRFFLKNTLLGVVATGIFFCPLMTVQAQSSSQSRSTTSRVTFVPPNGDRPQDSQGGAARNGGKCPQDDQNIAPYLTSVVPNTQRLTIQEKATIFVYIPETKAEKAFISFKDDQGQHLYQTFIPLTQKGGIVKITLPSDAPSLAVGTEYKWSLSLICGDRLLPDSPAVTGTIHRVVPSPQLSQALSALGETPSLKQANLLGKEGIWYDMLSVLMELKEKEPNNPNLQQIWSEVLESVQLEAISAQPTIANQ